MLKSRSEVFYCQRQRNSYIRLLLTTLLSLLQFKTTTSANSFNEDQRKIQETAIDDQYLTTIEKIIDNRTRNSSDNRICVREKSLRYRRALYFCYIINER